MTIKLIQNVTDDEEFSMQYKLYKKISFIFK